MMRDDWWWPWWVSSLIDVGVVVLAVLVFRRSSHRLVRIIAVAFVLAGLVAAVMAPIVMTDNSNDDHAPMMR